MPRPVGAASPPPLGYTLAGLDPNNADITGSIRERLSQRTCDGRFGRTRRCRRSTAGSRATVSPASRAIEARKGDRLALAAHGDRLAPAQQAQVEPEHAKATTAQQEASDPASRPRKAPLAVAQADAAPVENAARRTAAQSSRQSSSHAPASNEYRVAGINPRQPECIAPSPAPPHASAEADVFDKPNAGSLASLAFVSADANPSLRAARLSSASIRWDRSSVRSSLGRRARNRCWSGRSRRQSRYASRRQRQRQHQAGGAAAVVFDAARSRRS